MRSLEQIEARVAITSAPYTISAPGSYYLAAPLTVSGGDAIVIETSGVTLDLNGFAISSNAKPASGNGIVIHGQRSHIAISNGSIVGPGFVHGVNWSTDPVFTSRVTQLSVSNVSGAGISLGVSGTLVQACNVRSTGSYGIIAQTICDSIALDCGFNALLGNSVDRSYGQSNGATAVLASESATDTTGVASGPSGSGIQTQVATNCRASSTGSEPALAARIAQNCVATNQGSGGGAGLAATDAAMNCSGSSSSGHGLTAAVATNCVGTSTGGTFVHGIVAENVHSCYGKSASGIGIQVGAMASNCTGEGIHSGLNGLKGATMCHGIRTATPGTPGDQRTVLAPTVGPMSIP